MNMFSQGDLIRIHGFQNLFLIVSKNAYIAATNTFHVCPVLKISRKGRCISRLPEKTEKRAPSYVSRLSS